jgi:IS30 family transposase
MGKKKYRRGKNKESGPGCIPNRVDIDQRPVIVNRKRRYGDLKIDTIIGGEAGSDCEFSGQKKKIYLVEVSEQSRF